MLIRKIEGKKIMLKWLLTGGHLGLIVALLLMVSLAISYYTLLFVHHYTYEHPFVKENKFVILAIYASSFVLFVLMMTVLIFTKQENQYDGDWKVVQANDEKINLKITIKEEKNAKAENIDLDFNTELGGKATLLKNNKEYAGKIEAYMNGKQEIRSVELKSINGKLLPNSKISKVEYRKLIGYQQNLFGLVGYIEPSEYDGELRLTVEQSGDPKLEHLFEKE